MKAVSRWVGAGLILLTGILPASAGVCPPDCGIPEGRMTGGGVIRTLNDADGRRVQVTHEFELHCDLHAAPGYLEVTWGNQQFVLASLGFAGCEDLADIDPNPPRASFDTIAASGYGRLNGDSGAFIFVLFTDAGEPGRDDATTIVIYDSSGNLVLNVTEYLDGGNHQAHEESAGFR
jgi:hypothetical protein